MLQIAEVIKQNPIIRARILLVEDDASMQEGIRDVLELDGYEVFVVANGVEALRAMEFNPPDLVLSDIMMPQMDGLSFCERVRQRADWATIPFVFITAKGQKDDIRVGMHSGADDYITKPFDMQELLDAVQARLRRANSIKADTVQQLSGLRAKILRVISHEFRTPLTFVKGYSELLEEASDELSADELSQFLRSIKTGSDRLSSLVDDLIFLLSLETGEAKLAYDYGKSRLRLGDTIMQVIDDCRAKAESKRVTMVARRLTGLPAVTGYYPFVYDAFRRVLDNALKFSKPEGGWVTIEGAVDRQRVVVCVQDNGIGIGPAELQRIFQTFYQVDREHLEQQGAGVGLSIVQGIMRMHGGEVLVESEQGKGSTFSLIWPREYPIMGAVAH